MSQQSKHHRQGRYVEYDNKPGQYLYGTEIGDGSYGQMYIDDEAGVSTLDLTIQDQYEGIDSFVFGPSSSDFLFDSDAFGDFLRFRGEPGAYRVQLGLSFRGEDTDLQDYYGALFHNGNEVPGCKMGRTVLAFLGIGNMNCVATVNLQRGDVLHFAVKIVSAAVPKTIVLNAAQLVTSRVG